MASVTIHHDEETPLVVESPIQLQPHKSHSRDVHILSIAFVLIFLAYGAAQNLQSTLNTEEDLGTTSLGILYLSFTFFSVFASLVVRILGSKNALIIGTSGYWLYVAANLKPNWYTLVPASVYLGFCASIIWVGQGTYLTSTAHSHAIDNNLHEGAVIGDFNGEFWAVYALHQFIGNLITFALLSDGQGGSTNGTTLLFVVFLFVMTFGAILMFFLHKRIGNSKEEYKNSEADVVESKSLKSLCKSLTSALSDAKMLLIIPLMAYSGLQQAFVWAEFTKFVVTPAIGVSGVGIAMAAYGAFDGICSLAAGRLTSGLTSITSIVSFGAFAQAVALILLLLNFSISSGFLGTSYILFLAALLGIGDGVLMTQLNALLGILFKHDMEGAFAQLKIWQSATIAVVLENFHLDMELGCGDDYFVNDCNNLNIDGDDFLREILLQTPEGLISSEYDQSDHSFFHVQTDFVTVNVNGGVEVVGNMVKSNSSNSIVSQQHQQQEQEQEQQQQQHGLKSKRVPRKSSSPKTYILSFDNSTMIPATPEPCVNLSSRSKRSRESTQKAEVKSNQQINRVKKGRSSSQCIDHIMAERKRRQELSEKFIALSATIPGLSKMDKASILREAIDYVKQLKERVEELEKQDKNVVVMPVMVLRGINNYNEDTNSGETSCDDDCNHHILPDIEARVIGKEVLIEIHCEKQNGIELKLLNNIENLQLFVTGSSVLPFGKSAISITVIARMGDECKVQMNDLVKSIRQVLLKP